MKKILLLLIIGCHTAFSQTIVTQEQGKNVKTPGPKPVSKYHFISKAKYYGDSVVLRWSASEAVLWQLANKTGYNIDRFEVNGGRLTNPVRIVTQLKPWSLEEWKSKCKREDTTAAVLAQMLYGVSKELSKQQGDNNIDGIINQRNDIDNRFFIVNMMACWHPFHAKGLALRWVDKTIAKDKRYVYQVSSPISRKLLPSDTASVLIETSRIEPRDKMLPVTVEQGDRSVKLKWSKMMSDLAFTGYYYERSADNGKTFKRLNKKPFLKLSEKEDELSDQIVLTDSLPQNYRAYLYRIAGINHFGELSEYSPNLVVTGTDLTPPSMVSNLRTENTGGGKVKITWEKKSKETDFIGYVIGRSQSISGPFEPLQKQFLPKESVLFMDDKAEIYGTNYYVVSAVDTAGNASISLPAYAVMKDESAPARPEGLKGSIDTTGIVRITWNKNKEPDLMGYMVYTANAADHVFTPITSDFLADEFFADSTTLKSLTKNKFFKVVAFDKSRRASPYSEILTLKRPDKVPPVTPVFENFTVSDSSAGLKWIASTSEDVVKQVLYRREDQGSWQEIASFDAKTNTYSDKTVKSGTWYNYAVAAVDDAGLQSAKSFPLRIRPYTSGAKPPIRKFNAALTPDNKQAVLKWNYDADCRILIYRNTNGKGLVLIENVPGSQQEYTDKINATGTYRYAIKAIYKNGSETLMSAYADVVSRN